MCACAPTLLQSRAPIAVSEKSSDMNRQRAIKLLECELYTSHRNRLDYYLCFSAFLQAFILLAMYVTIFVRVESCN